MQCNLSAKFLDDSRDRLPSGEIRSNMVARSGYLAM